MTTEAPTAAERAHAELKRRIMNAELAPNEQRLEAELAAELGMSRTPLREACVRLEADGLVEIVPRRGIRVVPISAKDMSEVYELLAVLEAHAAQMAAERGLDDAALRPLDDAVSDMEMSIERGDLDGWAAADDRFHLELVIASGNRHLAATATSFADRVRRARLVTLRLRPIPKESVADHADLVFKIQSGQGTSAHDSHLKHRRRTSEGLVRLLAEVGISNL